jgi:hypothetical protein
MAGSAAPGSTTFCLRFGRETDGALARRAPILRCPQGWAMS